MRAIESGRFRTRAGTLEYAHVSGDGEPTLCLLHGLGARWQTFRLLMRALGPGWNIYAPDLRGHGRSDWVAGHYALADFAADIEQFVTEVIAGPVVLVGHSMGGWISAMVAAARPELVRGVVIVDSALYRMSPEQREAMVPYARPNHAMRSIAVSLRLADPELNQRWVEGRNQREQDPDEMLSRLRCPVLLVQGDQAAGALMTPAHVRRALSRLAHGSHVFVPGAGHAVHSDAPGPVADALREFLARRVQKSELNGEVR
ncbi:alpha/beta fold hydrolase [Nocardia crassostreae]|uniref:alpha/beta fold hydrolase n=1 Tax=Nocardia crassostreae TaxID=53428 RepID=UPI0008369F6D|nr:alpha/beta hydrolase [Nocardia crassostreae]